MGKLPRQKVKYFLPAAQVTLKGLAWKCAVAAAVTANLWSGRLRAQSYSSVKSPQEALPAWRESASGTAAAEAAVVAV